MYFLEVQFYPLPSVFADLLTKIYTYLKQHDPGQSFCGVVLFANRSLEPKELTPYQPLLDAGLIQDVYLTKSATSGGEPNTPLYSKPLHGREIVRKRGTGSDAGVTFEHVAISKQS